MMQRILFAYLFCMFTLPSFAFSERREDKIPFIRQALQGTWCITKFEHTSVIDGQEETQRPLAVNTFPKINFLSNNHFKAEEMSISTPENGLQTYSFFGKFMVDDVEGILQLTFNDPIDNQPIQLFFQIQTTEEGIQLHVSKEELFKSMDFSASKDIFTQSLNEVFKESIQSYASHYFLKKSYQ